MKRPKLETRLTVTEDFVVRQGQYIDHLEAENKGLKSDRLYWKKKLEKLRDTNWIEKVQEIYPDLKCVQGFGEGCVEKTLEIIKAKAFVLMEQELNVNN